VNTYDSLENDATGQTIFGLIDACQEGELDAADGNWSTQYVDCAANGENIEAMLVQAGITDPNVITNMVAASHVVARIMQRSDRAWEQMDSEVGFLERHGPSALRAVGSAAGVLALITAPVPIPAVQTVSAVSGAVSIVSFTAAEGLDPAPCRLERTLGTATLGIFVGLVGASLGEAQWQVGAALIGVAALVYSPVRNVSC